MLLQDTRPELTAQANEWLTYVIDHANNGWLGPAPAAGPGDMVYWSRWPLLKAMLQYMEGTGDARMLPTVMTWQRIAAQMLPTTTLGYTWQGVRWQDWAQINEYLIDSGLLGAQDVSLLYNMTWTIYNEALAAGVDWERKWYVEGWMPKQAITGGFNLTTHGVNNAQALKSGAVYYRFSGDPLGVQSSYERMALLDKYHGVPSGMFQADEHLAGAMPSHGTETCAVAEAIFSWNIVHEYVGDALFADRAEHILYNAMPAALTKNFTARVYLQSSNEIAAVVQNPHVWYADGPDAIIYSLQGNYACCTANFHQAWPKAVQHSVHASPDGGAALSILAPVVATLPSGVTIDVDTEYPFGDDVTVSLSGLAPSTPFPFYIRIPSWSTNATISVNGPAQAVVDANNTMYKILLTGQANATIVLNTNPAIRVTGPWYNNAVAVQRGALVYTLQLQEVMTVTQVYSNVSADYNVTLPSAPTTPWNIALITDPSDPDQSKYFTFHRTGPIPFPPFASQNVPLTITAQARQVNAWGTVLQQPDAPPASPVNCSQQGACGAPINVTLIPFGTTHLRLTELPYILP